MAESRVNLVATKSLRYATRRLLPEDGFSAKPRDARLLVAIGKARYATADGKAADIKPKPASAPAQDERAALRKAYTEKTGKKPFAGWDANTLRAKISEA